MSNPDCCSVQDDNYKTPLHYLVSKPKIAYKSEGYINLVKYVLEKISRETLSSYDENSLTPLHIACLHNELDIDLLELLINHGADPTLFDGGNVSVIDYLTHDVHITRFGYSTVNRYKALEVLNVGVQPMVNKNILPTIEELVSRYGEGEGEELAFNMKWALYAMNYVMNTNILRAANNLKRE